MSACGVERLCSQSAIDWLFDGHGRFPGAIYNKVYLRPDTADVGQLIPADVGQLLVLRFEGTDVVAYGYGQGEGVAGEVGLEDGDGVNQTSLEVELHDA